MNNRARFNAGSGYRGMLSTIAMTLNLNQAQAKLHIILVRPMIIALTSKSA